VSAAVRFVDIESPLEGVHAHAWQRWITALTNHSATAERGGGLGTYNIRPRRLVEIGRAANFRRLGKKQFCDFIAPWTEEKFLSRYDAQYAVLVKSMRLYYDALRDGAIKKPDGMSMSGALAILHAGGIKALEHWPDLFDGTKALYEATKGIF
jgi:hypothetical protein